MPNIFQKCCKSMLDMYSNKKVLTLGHGGSTYTTALFLECTASHRDFSPNILVWLKDDNINFGRIKAD